MSELYGDRAARNRRRVGNQNLEYEAPYWGELEMPMTAERLRLKLSPQDNRRFAEHIQPKLPKLDLTPYIRVRKKRPSYSITPRQLWKLLFPNIMEPSKRDIMILGHILMALRWEKSYLHGVLVYCKPVAEFEQDGY